MSFFFLQPKLKVLPSGTPAAAAAAIRSRHSILKMIVTSTPSPDMYTSIAWMTSYNIILYTQVFFFPRPWQKKRSGAYVHGISSSQYPDIKKHQLTMHHVERAERREEDRTKKNVELSFCLECKWRYWWNNVRVTKLGRLSWESIGHFLFHHATDENSRCFPSRSSFSLARAIKEAQMFPLRWGRIRSGKLDGKYQVKVKFLSFFVRVIPNVSAVGWWRYCNLAYMN